MRKCQGVPRDKSGDYANTKGEKHGHNDVTERGIVMNTESNKLRPSIGFIGMAHMGSHMVQRLLDAGYQVTVYDRTKEKAQEVGQRGALVASTPKELAANCQVVMACVTNDEAQHDVMFGPDGALAGVRGGSVIIDLSTVSPDA